MRKKVKEQRKASLQRPAYFFCDISFFGILEFLAISLSSVLYDTAGVFQMLDRFQDFWDIIRKQPSFHFNWKSFLLTLLVNIESVDIV